ncbi:hypothetical protein [Desulfosporosinus sp. I2]|uniref:hypothetical protein n=1 Tax=Desulfosporosinus sp. I2 TaxID=1617025 RepID=UPI0012DFF75B|nr:hypothetical protein [Desulfosporosinus sp. I2]
MPPQRRKRTGRHNQQTQVNLDSRLLLMVMAMVTATVTAVDAVIMETVITETVITETGAGKLNKEEVVQSVFKGN